MPLTSPRRSALADQVIAQLRAQITSGEWPVGSRIPTEPELVEQYRTHYGKWPYSDSMRLEDYYRDDFPIVWETFDEVYERDKQTASIIGEPSQGGTPP